MKEMLEAGKNEGDAPKLMRRCLTAVAHTLDTSRLEGPEVALALLHHFYLVLCQGACLRASGVDL